MLRTNTCGELRKRDCAREVVLCGWVQRSRDLGSMTFIDIRDRYGITQLTFSVEFNPELYHKAKELGREDVIKASGTVVERSNKNLQIPTGEIEVIVQSLEVLNSSQTVPFTIEDETDGGEELRMKYRYLDLRRNIVREKLLLRHQMAFETRNFLNQMNFVEVETPVLIKSTPEGARDFLVPSRMNPGHFYALPQSPQTFKQLLMVGGLDRYFQLVKCFRDEDFRADRQPEFTQIDCEMSFVTKEDIYEFFESLIRHLFAKIKGREPDNFSVMSYHDAIKHYGTDKPDTRFKMKFVELDSLVKGKGFKVFDDAELVVGIKVPRCAHYSRKQLDELTEWVKRPQIGGKGLVYVKIGDDGNFKSSVDKFYTEDDFKKWADIFDAERGDLLLIMAGDADSTRTAMGELRLEMGNRLELRKTDKYECLWVENFPLFEWDKENNRFHAMHHPFTSPLEEDIPILNTNPGEVRANAYDMVINGVEVGGGSIRIHNKHLQTKMFELLGISKSEADNQFGFLMDAFKYGAPPHGGIAFGFDRLCALFAGTDSIRDVIAFPKNNAGRDVMIDAPSPIDEEQLKELNLKLNIKK